MKTVYITRNELFRKIDMLLCNNITEVDKDFIEDNFSLFSTECETCKGTGENDNIDGKKCEDCCGDGHHDSEPYQYFLTKMDESEKEYFKSFGVEVGYSEALELEVIPIYDFGTSWSAFSYSKEVEDTYELAHNETLTRQTVY